MVETGGFFRKLANGEFGLAKTYWLYGFVVGLVVALILQVVTSPLVIIVVSLAMIAYSVPVLMGTWRATGVYGGPRIWAILAKIAVVLGVISLVLNVLGILVLIGVV